MVPFQDQITASYETDHGLQILASRMFLEYFGVAIRKWRCFLIIASTVVILLPRPQRIVSPKTKVKIKKGHETV